MARRVRAQSNTGYLHLILRGNNKQILFEEDEDYRFFLSRLGRYARETEVTLNAYCLMENHVHLLVNDQQGNVSEMMKKLEVSYTKRYNEKYECCGHLFQGRFLSELVQTEVYLLTVFRYILNNPQKAGICRADQYRWNSYKAYFRESAAIDLSFIRERFPTEKEYREYIGTPNEDDCMEYEPPVRDDEWAKGIIRRCFGVASGTELQNWEREKRDKALKQLKDEGLTVRQIERLTGIGRGIVQRL